MKYYATTTYNNSAIATQVENDSPISIIYNGATITTLDSGSVELDCANKVMNSRLKIGVTELDCANKLMTSRVKVDVVPWIEPSQSDEVLSVGSVYNSSQSGSILSLT